MSGSLEEVADLHTIVLIDSNIFDWDHDHANPIRGRTRDIGTHLGSLFKKRHGRPTFRRGDTDPRIRRSSRPSYKEIRPAAIQRRVHHVHYLNTMFHDYPGFNTTPYGFKEVEVLNKHINFVRRELLQKTHWSKGERRQLLESLRNEYNTLVQRLSHAKPIDGDEQKILDYLVRERMHIPFPGSPYVKKARKISPNTSDADASFIARAVITSLDSDESVAVLSNDLDVLNLAINFNRALREGLTGELSYLNDWGPQKPIILYSPAIRGWAEEHKVSYSAWIKSPHYVASVSEQTA